MHGNKRSPIMRVQLADSPILFPPNGVYVSHTLQRAAGLTPIDPHQQPGGVKEYNRFLFEREFPSMVLQTMKQSPASAMLWCKDEKRIYQGTKKELWSRIEEELGIEMSYSTFCRKSRELKKAKGRTDLCNLCERLKVLMRSKGEERNAEVEAEVKLLQEHKSEALKMREAFNKDVDSIQPADMVVMMDFKQDWNVPINREQKSREFYEKQTLTHLCIIVMTAKWVGGKLVKKKRVFHFLSEVTTKDIRYVSGCLRKALMMVDGHKETDLEEKKKLTIWVDAGTHFKNGFFLHTLFGKDAECLRHKYRPTLNFFAEGHGKSLCDGEFGVLSTAVKSKSISVQTIEEMKEFFDKTCTKLTMDNPTWESSREFIMFVLIPQLTFSVLQFPSFINC